MSMCLTEETYPPRSRYKNVGQLINSLKQYEDEKWDYIQMDVFYGTDECPISSIRITLQEKTITRTVIKNVDFKERYFKERHEKLKAWKASQELGKKLIMIRVKEDLKRISERINVRNSKHG